MTNASEFEKWWLDEYERVYGVKLTKEDLVWHKKFNSDFGTKQEGWLAALEAMGKPQTSETCQAEPLIDFVQALKIADGVFKQYQVDNLQWWKRMDGTPILNDISVRMAEAFCKAILCSKDAGLAKAQERIARIEEQMKEERREHTELVITAAALSASKARLEAQVKAADHLAQVVEDICNEQKICPETIHQALAAYNAVRAFDFGRRR